MSSWRKRNNDVRTMNIFVLTEIKIMLRDNCVLNEFFPIFFSFCTNIKAYPNSLIQRSFFFILRYAHLVKENLKNTIKTIFFFNKLIDNLGNNAGEYWYNLLIISWKWDRELFGHERSNLVQDLLCPRQMGEKRQRAQKGSICPFTRINGQKHLYDYKKAPI